MVFSKFRRNRASGSQEEPAENAALSPQEPPAVTFSTPRTPHPGYPSSTRASIIAQPSYPNTLRATPIFGMPAELGDGRSFGAFEQQNQYQFHQGPGQHFYGQQQHAIYAAHQQPYYEQQQYHPRPYEEEYEQQRRGLQEDKQRLGKEDAQRRFEREKRQSQAQKERDIEAQQRALEAEAKRKNDDRKAMELAERVSREEAQRLKLLTAEQDALKKKQNASKENVRRLRELIREKYRLDVWIWEHRGVQIKLRKYVKVEYEKSDAITQEIQFIVGAWDEKDFSEAEDWSLAKKIKEGLSKVEKQALWAASPPWDPSREEVRENDEET